jgi:hypothetical protein
VTDSPLHAGRSLRDLYTPSVAAPVGRNEKVAWCHFETGIHSSEGFACRALWGGVAS